MAKSRNTQPHPTGDGSRMKSSISILVVDDEQVLCDVLRKVLSREGYQVQTVTDGTAAMRLLANTCVDIMISDIMMPDINGLGLMQKVKERWPQIGVILMTGYGDTYTVKDAMLQGADEYITKPFKSREVSLVVERAYYRILSGSHNAVSENS